MVVVAGEVHQGAFSCGGGSKGAGTTGKVVAHILQVFEVHDVPAGRVGGVLGDFPDARRGQQNLMLAGLEMIGRPDEE